MIRRLAAAGLLALTPCPALAQATLAEALEPGQRPLWEAGLAVAGGWLPHYPASDETQFRGLPVPYVIYRGDIFQVGEGGIVRARTATADQRWEFSLGLDGSLDARSDDDEARRGMPDLDLLLEAGPQVEYRLTPRSSDVQVELSLEVRAVLATTWLDFDYQGYVVNPQISLLDRDLWGSGLSLYMAASPIFGFDGVNRYFYEVAPRYATATRPAYKADEGYMGTEFNIGLSTRLGQRVRVFAGVQVGYWGGAVNEDSPLFRDELTMGVGAGLVWRFYESEQTVGGPG